MSLKYALLNFPSCWQDALSEPDDEDEGADSDTDEVDTDEEGSASADTDEVEGESTAEGDTGDGAELVTNGHVKKWHQIGHYDCIKDTIKTKF